MFTRCNQEWVHLPPKTTSSGGGGLLLTGLSLWSETVSVMGSLYAGPPKPLRCYGEDAAGRTVGLRQGRTAGGRGAPEEAAAGSWGVSQGSHPPCSHGPSLLLCAGRVHPQQAGRDLFLCQHE